MKVESIKSNGISNTTPAKKIMAQLSVHVSLYRMRFSNDEIISKFPEDSNYHIGDRYESNSKVAVRIASAIVTSAISEYKLPQSLDIPNNEIMLEGIITAWFESLSASEIDILILDGLRDCASADHWYTFEKEW